MTLNAARVTHGKVPPFTIVAVKHSDLRTIAARQRSIAQLTPLIGTALVLMSQDRWGRPVFRGPDALVHIAMTMNWRAITWINIDLSDALLRQATAQGLVDCSPKTRTSIVRTTAR